MNILHPEEKEARRLDLSSLRSGSGPCITADYGGTLAECAAVCLEDQNHSCGPILLVIGDFQAKFAVYWEEVSEQMKRSHGDLISAVEMGAYGIAVLLVDELTEYTVVNTARRGPGFDFWLGKKGKPTPPLFQGSARLEVSGMLRGSRGQVNTRANQKLDRMRPSEGDLPGYAIVVEFGAPLSKMVRK